MARSFEAATEAGAALSPRDDRDRPAVLVVAGPTASGKSGLALALAEAFGGTVINGDALQVYRDLCILTARPGPEALTRAPHRLYGTIDSAEAFSAARWRALAVAEIAASLAAGRRPIVVGGTGLYLKALMEGLAPLPPIPATARAEARALHARLGAEAFHAALARLDPAMAQRLPVADTTRAIRAYEVMSATGRSLCDWWRETPADGPHRFVPIVLMPPREALYAACDARLVRMMEAGALAEVEALAARGLDPGLPVFKALGCRELLAHLRGEATRAQAAAAAQRATRNYAKRQLTWFRHQLPAAKTWPAQFSESLLPEIFTFIRRSC